MENNQLLKQAENLQEEAKYIVNDIGILDVLRKIGEPLVIGSVKNGLMVWRDIDIEVIVGKLDLNKVSSILQGFALLPTIQKVQFSNFRELRRDHIKSKKRFPHGYYIGLRSVQSFGEWNIDIWIKEKGDLSQNSKNFDFSNLSKEQKIAILKIKNYWLKEGGRYKNGVLSTHIYEAVLNNGVRNKNDFEDYIRSFMREP